MNYKLTQYWNSKLVPVVFEGCRTDDVHGFSCLPGHVINIYSAEVGVISRNNSFDDHWPCLVAFADCSWSIDEAVIAKCNQQQSCHITPDVYNNQPLTTTPCPQHRNGNLIKITYNCIADEVEGLLSDFVLLYWENISTLYEASLTMTNL